MAHANLHHRSRRRDWYYEQIIYSNTGSVTFTITTRENFFDGVLVSTIGTNFEIPGNGSVRFRSRWCSGYSREHVAQTRFRGVDSNGGQVVFSGPVVRLLAK